MYRDPPGPRAHIPAKTAGPVPVIRHGARFQFRDSPYNRMLETSHAFCVEPPAAAIFSAAEAENLSAVMFSCLLYTSDAADE